MRKNQIVVAAIVFIIILIATVSIFVFVNRDNDNANKAPVNPTFVWSFEPAETNNLDGNPQTRVYVTAIVGDAKDERLVDTVDGGCSKAERVQCYYAGLGQEYRITQVGAETYNVERKLFEEALPDVVAPEYQWEVIEVFSFGEDGDSSISFLVASTTLSVIDNGKVTQTLSLDEEGEFAYNVSPTHEAPAFTTDNDFNFDGYSDVSKLVSTGYTGVNYFYEYYMYNPQTRMLERSDVLEGVSNPVFDVKNKRITSSYRSGPQWYSEVFQWNGTTYIKSEAVANEN